ncbi:MAG: NAD-dependent epimerase/dehydratase family protein, partial [Planctomycetes bacterium]|nr:NAD-dependent epimerase/dehydratase family protein [Planctomycetota bacterium]
DAPADAKSRFFEADLAESAELHAICEGAQYVFHLAALADIVPSITEPLAYHRSNVEGTVRLLEAIRAAGGKAKVVYAASSSCYGIPDELPTPETADIRPQYPYALTKHIAEQYVHHWGQVYGLPVVSLRFFNVYGPRARTAGTYGAVFGVFLAQKLAGEALTVVGDGRQTRDFVYVTDVAEACVRAAKSDLSGEVLNVGAGNPQSINRLCELIGGATVHLPKRPGEPDCTRADINKIRRLLDWSPTVSFEEGVSRMLETIESWREAPVWTPHSIAEATRDWFAHLQEPGVCHA